MKKCSKCGVHKPFESFSKHKGSASGLRPSCRACVQKYRKDHAAQIRESNRLYRAEHLENYRLYQAKYAEANAEQIAKARSIWQKNNRELENQKNHRRRALLRKSKVYLITKKELRKLYLSDCFYCGAKELVTVDHVIPLNKGGAHSIGNLVPACKTCNSSKKDKLLMEWRRWKNARGK